jgi:hypothetical protein
LISLRAIVILLVGVIVAGGAAVAAAFSGCTLIEILAWAGGTFVASSTFLKSVTE